MPAGAGTAEALPPWAGQVGKGLLTKLRPAVAAFAGTQVKKRHLFPLPPSFLTSFIGLFYLCITLRYRRVTLCPPPPACPPGTAAANWWRAKSTARVEDPPATLVQLLNALLAHGDVSLRKYCLI